MPIITLNTLDNNHTKYNNDQQKTVADRYVYVYQALLVSLAATHLLRISEHCSYLHCQEVDRILEWFLWESHIQLVESGVAQALPITEFCLGGQLLAQSWCAGLSIDVSRVQTQSALGMRWGLCWTAASSCAISALYLITVLVPMSIRHKSQIMQI